MFFVLLDYHLKELHTKTWLLQEAFANKNLPSGENGWRRLKEAIVDDFVSWVGAHAHFI